jgi:hypothetical protein
LQNKLINAITQSSAATGQALWPAFGDTVASATTNLTNQIRNTVTMENIQRSYTSIRQTQSVGFENSGVWAFSDVDLSQGSKLFAAATIKELDRADIFNQIENSVAQSAEATVKSPFDFLTAPIIILIIVIFFAIMGGLAWVLFSGGESDGGDDIYGEIINPRVI